MYKLLLLLCVVTVASLSSKGQNRELSTGEYKTWKSISHPQISHGGEWVTYQLAPNKGDGTLVILHTKTNSEIRIARGHQASIDDRTKKLICLISPREDIVDSLKRIRTKPEELPIDSLAILDLVSGNLETFGNIQSFEYSDKWQGWIFHTLNTSQDSVYKKTLPRKLKKDESTLVIHHLPSGTRDTFEYTRSFTIAKENPALFLHQTAADSSGKKEIKFIDLASSIYQTIHVTYGMVENLQSSEDGKMLTFLADQDSTESPNRKFAQYLWTDKDSVAKIIVHPGDPKLPLNWIPSEKHNSTFAKDGSRIFFGAAPESILQDTNLLEDEIVQVEIWNYRDQTLYPQQKIEAEKEKYRSYLFTYDRASGNILQIGGSAFPSIILHPDLDLDYAIALDDLSKRKAMSWEAKIYKDLSIVSLLDGSKQLIKDNITGTPNWSPGGKFIYWYESIDTSWYIYDLSNDSTINLTKSNSIFSDEMHDMPIEPSSYGLMGWSENDTEVFLYDRYDIWSFKLSDEYLSKRVTEGREIKTKYRYVKLDTEEKHLPTKRLLLHGVNEINKRESYSLLDLDYPAITDLLEGDFKLTTKPIKADSSDQIIFTLEDFVAYPDLHLTSDLEFDSILKISNANPQQKEFRWGTIELFDWESKSGEVMQGLLVKPANFDPNRKYPMIVNFYERSSDRLHVHLPPAPGRSTINYSFYASNDYVIFNPDVSYDVGHPGRSAYEDVISGTEAIINLGFIDPERIGLQGHSWGGYQIAHLLTKTDLFACAEAGAPVVNMISAYGGIRWATGLSRMFQYEHTQSRLGATLWERPELYLENSPIFEIDKINTPVLVMHNDNDGHVPWYQGIEFFVALRRLNKPAWMLNYNGEPHWPLKWQNRMDFNIRLFQFFEHYLKGEPMPVWMDKGVPAYLQGIERGLEMRE